MKHLLNKIENADTEKSNKCMGHKQKIKFNISLAFKSA